MVTSQAPTRTLGTKSFEYDFAALSVTVAGTYTGEWSATDADGIAYTGSETYLVGTEWVERIVDSYQAKVWLADDDDGTTDRYLARWFKNGEPYGTAAATTIQVIKSADGANLIAPTAMTQIGSTPRYKYDATGAERIVDGAGYIVIVSATIDGDTRTWEQPVSRDSDA